MGLFDCLRKCCIIPQRYILAIMGFFAVLNAYTMRICLSVGMTVMTKHPAHKDDLEIADTCPSDAEFNKTHVTYGEYEWDSKLIGLILGSFFYGYVITHIPGGVIAEKLGGKWVLGVGLFGTVVFTLLTPLIVHHFHAPGLIVLRIAEGLGEGVTYPALNFLLSRWVPHGERSILGTLVYSGAQMGTIVGNTLSGYIIHHMEDWESVFYFFGIMAGAWVFFWAILCYSTPESHPYISEKELEYLKGAITPKDPNQKIPWKQIMRSVPMWALVAAAIGHDWGFFTMVTDLPIYMSDILKFNVKANGLLSSAPFLCMWIFSQLSAVLCDYLIYKNVISVTFARKFFTAFSSIGPGACLLGASYSGCNQYLAVGFFCLSMTMMGFYYPGMKVNALDLAPNFAGTIMALVNGIGAFTGIFTPMLIGFLTTNHTLGEWRLVFWLTFGVLLGTAIIFIFFASADRQPWDYGENER